MGSLLSGRINLIETPSTTKSVIFNFMAPVQLKSGNASIEMAWPSFGWRSELSGIEDPIALKAKCSSLKTKRPEPGYKCQANGCKFKSKYCLNFVGH